MTEVDYNAHGVPTVKRGPQYDNVKRPIHYAREGIPEVYPFIKGRDLNFAEGNVVKYICRWQEKGGIIDLQKAKWYLDELIKEALRAQKHG